MTADNQTVHAWELLTFAPQLRRVGYVLVGFGDLAVGSKPRRAVLPVSYGFVRNSFEGIEVSDSGNHRDNKNKYSANTEQKNLC